MPIEYIEQGHNHLDAVQGRQQLSTVIRSAQYYAVMFLPKDGDLQYFHTE